MRLKVEKVMEIVRVSSPIANAALVAEGGDVNNASSSVLLKEREKRDASGSVQRMQADIEEEAANVIAWQCSQKGWWARHISSSQYLRKGHHHQCLPRWVL